MYSTMKKHVFMLIALVAMVAFALPAKAQMSDDEVISYVKAGVSNGKSQNTLIRELTLKGVTREQAERIQKKMQEAEKTGKVKAIGAEAEGGRQFMEEDELDSTIVEKPKMDSTMVFGRNVFSIKSLSFAPSMNIATPENYKLGPGDEVIIDIWGTNEATIRQKITPDGYINVESIGLVYLTGMTVKEADDYMRRQLGRIYSVEGENAQSDIKLTLGSIRSITVNVMGEVVAPGTYSLSSLSSVYHALYKAGGFSDLGSVRNVSLVRNGRKIADVDVYDLIVKGKPANNTILQDGDVVLVPTYESVVTVTGNVKRPMMYELKAGENITNLISYAGGFKGDAYTAYINVERRNGREYQVYTVKNDKFSTFALIDGDSIDVGTIVDRYENRLEIKGAVYRPGFYELNEETNTVSALIKMADGLRGDAFTNRALLHREREDYSLELIQVDLKGILNGTVPDIILKKNDVLTISNINDLRDLGYITVVGEVSEPGMYDFAENTTIEDIIIQAGGLLESASIARVDVSRRIKNPTSTEEVDSLSQVFSFEITDLFALKEKSDFVLQPYDQVYVRRSPGYSAQAHVKLEGEVTFPGAYVLKNKNTRLSDVVKLAGGTSSWAYIKGARLSRQMTEEDRMRLQSVYSSMSQLGDSISEEKLKVAEEYFVGINLEKALANPGSDADVVLREGDRLIVPEYSNTIKISGCVLHPNTVSYDSKMTVDDYINQAGGYGFKAKKSRAYIIYMNGTIAKAKKNSKAVVEPGCEIIIPEKRKKDGSGLQQVLSIATTSASLATMFGTLYNIIK